MLTRLIAAGLAFVGLAACASTPPGQPPASSVRAAPDYRADLVRPCANAGDWSPWRLVDAWEDGEVYEPETQFRNDGVMVYAYNGNTYDNGKWTLEGSALHFDTNNHYADYDGTFDGERASGKMKNVDGGGGTWTLTRDCAS